jgi:PAS domain S-box-containing protein
MKREEERRVGIDHKERQVLLIINETEVCKKLQDTIHEKFGFETETAVDGQKALKVVQKSPWQYDVAVIYDNFQKKPNGLEILKSIKKSYQEIEVIFIIDSTDKTTVDAWQEGAFNCFSLPINYEGVAHAAKFAKEQAQFRRERKMLEKLQELSVAINSAVELQEIQNIGCKAAVEIFNADHSALVLFEKDLSTGKVIAEYPETKDFIGIEIQVKGIPAEERLVYNKEIINISNAANFEAFKDIKTLINAVDIRSILIVPVVLGGNVIASFSLDMKSENRIFYPCEIELCRKLADQIAVAIGNAELFKDARRRIRALEIVDNIVHIMSTKLNTEDLLQTMVTQITEKLNCSHCTIFFPEMIKGQPVLVPRKTHGLNTEQIITRTFRPGEGLAGWVFQHGKSIVAPDVRNDKRYAPARQRKSFPHSMLVVPLKVGAKTIGVICAEQDKINWFSESDRQLVDTLARHAGIAIERALDLNLLQEIGLQIISIKEEKETLQRIITGTIELTNTTSGIIYSVSDDGKSVVRSYPYPPDLDHPPPRMHREKGLTRKIINEGKILMIPDISKDARVNPRLLEYLRSLIGVPLKIKKKVVGVLFLHDKKPRSFTEMEISLLEILASQAAIAIYNSRLYQESQRQLTEIEALYETSQEIAAETMNMRSVFDAILDKAIKLSNADSAQIIFHDEAKNQLKIVFSHGLDVLKGVTFKPGEGLTSKVFETGEPIFTGDYFRHPEREKIFDEPKYRNLYNSLAIVPLKWKGAVLGAIALTSASYNKFTESDIRLLERFSGPAAIAIATAREISFRQTLLNNSPHAIVAIDRKGIIREFNRATEQILGYDTSEMLFSSVINIWGGIEEACQIKRKMFEDEYGTVRDVEAYVVNKSGEKIPVLFSGSLLYAEGYGEDKEEIGSIGHLEDQRIVSLRGRTRRLFEAIEEINRTEELPKLLKIILHHAINLLEADSGYIMLEEDDYFEIVETHNFKQNLHDKININFNDGLIGPILKKGIPRALSNSPHNISEIPTSNKNKSVLVIPLRVKHDIIGLIYLESNMADYFREEDELIEVLSAQSAVSINRTQLLEEKEKTLERLFASAKAVAAGLMAGGFVHEVKNSLNNIGMAVGNIRRRIQKDPNIEAKKLLDKIRTIESEILQSYNLSMRLHKFGQHVAHRKVEESVNEIVKNTLELLEITIKRQQIRLELKLDPILDKHKTPSNQETNRNLTFIDKDQIKQVIINLVLNAIDASMPRSRLIIETKSEENHVEINIKDFGKGIESKNLTKIFEPFFTTKPEGVGLGLYISKLIIEDNHQGKIEIKSKPGKGTTFSVMLPKKEKESAHDR